MDFFYDGQIRRYVTQFMRVFIGFKYQAGDGTEKLVPVTYGDMTRQVAAIIKENSENKLPSVPKISCYITGLELDRSRLSDASYVSKVNIRERSYEFDDNGMPVYGNNQGAGYTVERLMPTPFKLTMRADIWTSNTDQKLQLLEQILVLFNPSLEVQTTDNYIDWTSLTTVEMINSTFTSRSIPAGVESEIDICTLDFEMPIYISPPVKVKKLGIVQNIIMNMFSDDGQLKPLSELAFNYVDGPDPNPNAIRVTPGGYGVLLLKADTGNLSDRLYNVSVLNPNEAVTDLGLNVPIRHGQRLDWTIVLEQYEGYTPAISQIRFLQPSGAEIVGTFVVNEVDSTFLQVTLDADTVPTNTLSPVDAIINPSTFNPLSAFGGHDNIPNGTRYLVLEDIIDNADAWKNKNGSDFAASENDIIQWNSSTGSWNISFDASESTNIEYVQNIKTLIQYKWEDSQWLKSFEGEYAAGYWSFDLNP